MIAFEFRCAVDRIQFGAGAVAGLAAEVRRHGARHAALVMDSFIAATPWAARLTEHLQAGGDCAVTAIAIPDGEPDVDTVAACHRALTQAAPDLIVAVGGGSTMDTAKVARLMLANDGTAESLAGFDRILARHCSRFICIPTTAGTASEVSEMAVIGVPGGPIKLRYRPEGLAADLAILDPELLISLPPALTAMTGFDALTHAIESYVSRLATPLTDALALDAVARLARALPAAYATPDDVEARGECLYASMLAGLVFNSTQLGLCHAIAAPLGAIHHVAHGLANALVLPAVLAFNEPALGRKSAALANALGGGSASAAVTSLRRRLGLCDGLDRFVPTEAERRTIAAATLQSGNIRTTPRTPTFGDVLLVLDAARHPLVPARALLTQE